MTLSELFALAASDPFAFTVVAVTWAETAVLMGIIGSFALAGFFRLLEWIIIRSSADPKKGE